MSDLDRKMESFIASAMEDFRDGVLSQQRLENLRQLLASDANARRFFVEQNHLTQLIASQEIQASQELVEEPFLKRKSEARKSETRRSHSGVTASARWWVSAATVALLCGAALYVMSIAGRHSEPTPRDIAVVDPGSTVGSPTESLDDADYPSVDNNAVRPGSSDSPVAVLVRSDAAKWRFDDLNDVVGVPLRSGWLDLVSGTAAIRFNQGAVVTLTGPARLQLGGVGKAYLESGHMVATVPPEAVGFEIKTRAMNLIDHGTEFAVRASLEGDAEVHVLEGEVEVEYTDADSKTSKIAMTGQQARRFVDKVDSLSVEMDDSLGNGLEPSRSEQRIGLYTFDSKRDSEEVDWTTDPSPRVVGGHGVTFSPFQYRGVVPGPSEFEENLNRWSFKNWRPRYQMKKFYVGFSVEASAGQLVDLNSLTLELMRAGGNDHPEFAPQDGVLRVSSDGFKTFRRFVLMDEDTFVQEAKFVSANLSRLPPASQYEFRFLFKGPNNFRAIRLDEVTLELDVLDSVSDPTADAG